MRPDISYCMDEIRKQLTDQTALHHLDTLENEFHRLEDVIQSLVKYGK